MDETNLEPMTPEEALELYLQDRRTDLTKASLQAHRYRLNHLIRWCDEKGIDNLNGLSGRDMHRYKLWRRDDGDFNKVTVKTQMDTVRVFIRWCENIDAVHPDLSEKVVSPPLDDGDNQRDIMLEANRAETILDYLSRFQYASFDHVTVLLLWHTGMRTGAIHGLDIGDYDSGNQRLQTHHRPDQGTPLKNKAKGERLIALNTEVCQVIEDWIGYNRPNTGDEYGRCPLITTSQGRVSKGTIRNLVYRWTRPCVISGECPHNREMETCVARDDHEKSYYDCPSVVSPHAIRRGSITYHLTEEVPEKVVSDRMNVGPEVLEKHYDQRTEEEKVEQRRAYLDNI